jgi:hypothetical protein
VDDLLAEFLLFLEAEGFGFVPEVGRSGKASTSSYADRALADAQSAVDIPVSVPFDDPETPRRSGFCDSLSTATLRS